MNPNDNSSNLLVTGSISNTISALNQTKIFRPKSTPKANACQLCLLVLDASGSMRWAHYGGQTKADAVNEGTLGLITRLKQSSKRADFHVGVINFDHRVIVRQQPIPVLTMELPKALLELDDLGDATDIGNALKQAHLICESFLAGQQAGGLPHSTVILLMSDGVCRDPEQTLVIAETIKQDHPMNKIKIVTSLFGDDNDESASAVDLLRTIASIKDGTPCFLQTDNVEALRNFFAASSIQA